MNGEQIETAPMPDRIRSDVSPMAEARDKPRKEFKEQKELAAALRVVNWVEEKYGKWMTKKDQIERLKTRPVETFVFCPNSKEFQRRCPGARADAIAHQNREKIFIDLSATSEGKPWPVISNSVLTHEMINFTTGLIGFPDTISHKRFRELKNPTIEAYLGVETIYLEMKPDGSYAAVEKARRKMLGEFLTDALATKVLEANGERYEGLGYDRGRSLGLKIINTVGENVVAQSMFKPWPELLSAHLAAKTGRKDAFEKLTEFCENKQFEEAESLLSK